MKGRSIIWIFVSLVLVWACTRDAEPTSQLGITIEFPEVSATKADVGEVSASTNENMIYDLKIWVFNHSTKNLEASFSTDSDFPEGGGVRRYALEVSTAFAISKPSVDVFVLVNSAVIGLGGLNKNNTWLEIMDATFGGDYFGTNPDKLYSAVPSGPTGSGLPMSGMGLDMSLSGSEPSFSLPTISVARMVSKLRYVFCQMKTEDSGEPEEEKEKYAVEKVVLDGGLIPSSQYVFSENAACRIASSYDSRTITTLWPTEKITGLPVALAENEVPEALSYAGQDGPTYEKMIQEALAANTLTNMGSLYLRESDKALTGTIYYTITKGNDTQEKTASFSMDLPGDFARNHTWTLYGYFISDRTLQLGIAALPWDINKYTIEFSSSSLQVWRPFLVDTGSATVVPIGNNHYNVFLDANRAAKGTLYVATPKEGRLEIIPEGTAADLEAFVVTPTTARIDPTKNNGRIDISIDRKRPYYGDTNGKTITLSFKAYTPDGEREIPGASECIDQVYHFYL